MDMRMIGGRARRGARRVLDRLSQLSLFGAAPEPEPDEREPLLPSKRQNPPPEEVIQDRQTWGRHLQDAIDRHGMSRTMVASLVGYNHVKGADQLVTGQNGASWEVYDRILEVFPEMRPHAHLYEPHIQREKRGQGNPGPHAEHQYPEGTFQRAPIVGRLPRRL